MVVGLLVVSPCQNWSGYAYGHDGIGAGKKALT